MALALTPDTAAGAVVRPRFDSGPFEVSSEVAELTSRCRFLERETPFAGLPPAAAWVLARHATTRNVAAGTLIVNEGEPAGECYLIREGDVVVLTSVGTKQERERGRIGPGGLAGEIALLPDARHTASVRASSDCRLLVLGRAALMEAVAADQEVALRVLELIHFRDRPRQVAGVLAFSQAMTDAEPTVILENPALRRYFRLSADGWKLWQAIDGEHSVRDLIVQQFAATGRLAPEWVTDLLRKLAVAGFAEATRLPQVEDLVRPPLWARIASRLTRFFAWEAVLTGCDSWISRLYARGVRVLFTPLALTLLTALAIAGFGAFIFALFAGRVVPTTPDHGGALLCSFPVVIIVSIVLHEAGHAFTAKFFGGEVDRVGIGWAWFGPVAFVDTSDMWKMARWPRIAVDLAGIAANVVCAGFAVLAALLISEGAWAAVLWQLALVSAWMALANLCPIMESDGFHALADWLNRPDLRRQTLAIIRHPAEWHRHRFELLYASAGLVFIAVMGVLVVGMYRILLEPWMARLIGERIAAAGSWLVALVFVLNAVLQLLPARGERLVRDQCL